MIAIQFTVIFMIIYGLESLAIIMQSSLIILVLGREWLQVKRLSPVDMILTNLGICHFFLQFSSMLFNFCCYFNPNYVFWYLSIIWEFGNILTFWITSLLAVFYCVKVSSFTHPIFQWLRWRVLRLVPWLLLGSLVVSFVTSIPSAITNHIRIQFLMEHLPRNSTMIERLQMFRHSYIKPHTIVALLTPFVLFLASTIILMASLVQHLEQMQHHNTGHCDPSMKAHSTALRSLVIFLIFVTSYFMVIFLTLIGSLFDTGSWFWLWEVVIYAVVSIHSASLMLSSPTLKKFLKVKC
ncbi:taste receptor type 2 member 16 [Carlito syrichta]|uniref:Taste receptor type 2 n=1 Tax=Carlito syrichta TaxID=1868482 RepID=A0A1U7TG92_CARSF|nr:taste receptor type 2 member 16 [Carlito syrichta]